MKRPSKVKYFLPILLTKIYLTALLSSVLKSNPFIFFIIVSLIEIIFSIFIIRIRPFQSNFTNLRLITISLLFLGTNIICCLYLYFSKQLTYIIFYEELIIYLIVGIAGMSLLFLILEHLLAWRKELWKLV